MTRFYSNSPGIESGTTSTLASHCDAGTFIEQKAFDLGRCRHMFVLCMGVKVYFKCVSTKTGNRMKKMNMMYFLFIPTNYLIGFLSKANLGR